MAPPDGALIGGWKPGTQTPHQRIEFSRRMAILVAQ
jgi:hypothetical protein